MGLFYRVIYILVVLLFHVFFGVGVVNKFKDEGLWEGLPYLAMLLMAAGLSVLLFETLFLFDWGFK